MESMMKQGIVNLDIYKVLSASSYKYTISMFDQDGIGTITPQEASWFYVVPVNFMINVPVDSTKPEVYLWKSADISDKQTQEVLERLKMTANQYGYGFTIYDFSKMNLPKKFSHVAMRDIEEKKISESLTEGFTGSATRSYWQLPRAKMIVVHSKRIQEEVHGSRSRNVKEVFIECNGERRRVPNNLHAAKAMTIHLNEGGSWDDKYSSVLNDYSNDLELLKSLLGELELASKSTYANKVKDKISSIKSFLRNGSTLKGYRDGVRSTELMPRISTKYIDDLSSRLNLSGNDDLNKCYAKHHLLDECSKLPLYLKIAQDNLCDYDPKELTACIKKMCLGNIPCGELSTKPQTLMEYAEAVKECVQDDIIRDILDNICTKPQIQPEDAQFILGVYNSVLGTVPKREILVEPEMENLKEWIEKI